MRSAWKIILWISMMALALYSLVEGNWLGFTGWAFASLFYQGWIE